MQRFRHCMRGSSRWDTHFAVATLLEIVELSMRGDLKSDLMKELERQIGNLTRWAQLPHVDQTRLQGLMDRERGLIDTLHAMSGPLGHDHIKNDFLNSIRQRYIMPGGTCDFDLPAYHHWLSRPEFERNAILAEWIRPFEQVQQAVVLILQLIRESVPQELLQAEKGFYQQQLDAAQPYQLIRISMPADSPYYPEISAGKQRFSVRFRLQDDVRTRGALVEETINFELACCAL